MNEEERKKIEKADEKELQSLAEWWRPDSGHGHLAKVRLDKLRHEALLPKPGLDRVPDSARSDRGGRAGRAGVV
jgi:hypothetical protein